MLRARPQAATRARPTLRHEREIALGDHVNALVWTAAGDLAIAATLDGRVQAVPTTGGTVRVLSEHAGGALSVDISDDLVATGGQDGRLRLVRILDGAALVDRDMGGSWVEYVRWSPTGRRLAAAAGKTVRFWTRQGAPAGEFRDHPGAVSAMWWDAGGQSLTTACSDGLRLLRPNRRRASVHIPWDSAGTVLDAVESPDERYIAMSHLGGTLSVLQVKTARSIQYGGFPGKIRQMVWSPNARRLAVAAGDKVALFGFSPRGPDRERARVLRGHDARVTALAFLPGLGGDGLLASACDGGRLLLWAQDRDFRRVGAVQLAIEVAQLFASGDGQSLAVAGRGGRLRIFSIAW